MLRRSLLLAVLLLRPLDAGAQCTGCTKPSFNVPARAWESPGLWGTDVAVDDFNRDGVPDLVTGGFKLFVSMGTVTGLFAPAVEIATTYWPASVVAADFDQDGIVDLGAASQNGEVAIHLGMGDGTFEAPLPILIDSFFYDARLEVGDLNGDGVPDLALGGTHLDLLFGLGDGTFQVERMHSLDTDYGRPVIADLDSDGDMDVAIGTHSGPVSVVLGNGRGDFSSRINSVFGGQTMAAGDYDRDGVLDLAVDRFDSIAILHGRGDGTFFSGATVPLGFGPNHPAVWDYDHDSILDLAVTTRQDGKITVLRGAGDGSFSIASVAYASDEHLGLLLVDINRDDRDDAVIPAAPGIVVLESRPDGSFPQPDLTLAGQLGFTTQGTGTVADFDQDGHLDWAQADANGEDVLVWIGDGEASFQSVSTTPLDASGFTLAAGFLDGDAVLDVAVATEAGVRVLLGSGDGTFGPPAALSAFFTTALAVGDFMGSDELDLLVSENGALNVYAGAGDGTFSAPVSTPVGLFTFELVVADFDDDGEQDVVLAGLDGFTVYLGAGDGTFAPGPVVSTGSRPQTLTAGDFDGDGALDIAAGAWSGTGLVAVRNLGSGTFAAPVLLATRDYWYSLAAADVTGDGLDDLVAGNANITSVFAGLTPFSFGTPFQFAQGYPLQVSTGDFDEDGRTDLVFMEASSLGVGAWIARNTSCEARRLGVAPAAEFCPSPSGSAFSAAPVVQILDDGGNVVTCDTRVVQASLVPGTGAPGALLVGPTAVPALSGVATFPNLAIDRAGRGYQLQFSAADLETVQGRTLTQGLAVTITGPSEICAAGAVYRTASGGYDRQRWTIGGVPVSFADPAILEGLAPGTHPLEVTVWQDACQATAVRSIVVEGIPAAPAIVAPESVPVGGEDLFASASPVLAGSIFWTLEGGTITGGQGTHLVRFSAGPPGTTMRLRASRVSPGGCESSHTLALVQVDFLDTGSSPYRSWINAIARNGVTGGCGGGLYCPDRPVTRAELAVLILRAAKGPNFFPPPAPEFFFPFIDVPPGAFARDWIWVLFLESITGGCAPSLYCPDASVTRAEFAVMLLRAEHGASYFPPPATGLVFADVPADAFAAAWIEQMALEGITGGCGGGNFCPSGIVSRAQVAVFLALTFNLH